MVQYFPVITGSLTVQGNVLITGSINTTAGITGSFSGTATTALTASSVANLNQNVVVTGSLTTTGQIVAQTLNVQQVTSSIVFSSGSNVFGNSTANTQQLTGSVSVTGSFNVVTTGTELQVGATGVTLGNALTDIHQVTGSLRVTGSLGIGTTNPTERLTVVGSGLFGSTGAGSYSLAISNNDQSNVRFRLTNTGTGGQSFSIVGGNPGISNSGLAIYDETNSATRLYVSSSGNIGMGTTSPTSKLYLLGDTTNYGITSENPSGYGGLTLKQISGNSYSIGLTTNNLFFYDVAAGATRMILSNSGSLGLGTANPTAPLTIAVPAVGSAIGATTSQQAFDYSRLRIKHYTDSSLGLSIGYAGANLTYIQACYNEGTTAPLLLNPFGSNVGVGTSSPTSLLEVQANQNAQTGIRVRNATAGSTAQVEFGVYTNSGNGGFGKYSTATSTYKNITAASLYIYNGSSGDIALLNDVSTGNITFAAGGAASAQITISSGGNIEYSQTPNANYNIATDAGRLSVANGGTINFQIFSGLIVINNQANGVCAMWLVGAGGTSLLGQSSGGATGTMTYNGGINGYTWTSNYGSTAFYGVFSVRTRSNA